MKPSSPRSASAGAAAPAARIPSALEQTTSFWLGASFAAANPKAPGQSSKDAEQGAKLDSLFMQALAASDGEVTTGEAEAVKASKLASTPKGPDVRSWWTGANVVWETPSLVAGSENAATVVTSAMGAIASRSGIAAEAGLEAMEEAIRDTTGIDLNMDEAPDDDDGWFD